MRESFVPLRSSAHEVLALVDRFLVELDQRSLTSAKLSHGFDKVSLPVCDDSLALAQRADFLVEVAERLRVPDAPKKTRAGVGTVFRPKQFYLDIYESLHSRTLQFQLRHPTQNEDNRNHLDSPNR